MSPYNKFRIKGFLVGVAGVIYGLAGMFYSTLNLRIFANTPRAVHDLTAAGHLDFIVDVSRPVVQLLILLASIVMLILGANACCLAAFKMGPASELKWAERNKGRAVQS